MIGALIFSAVLGLLIYIMGTAFDKTPDNRYAGLAGLTVFVVSFLSYLSSNQ